MMVQRQGENLNTWLSTVEADDQPHLRSFATGIRRDHDAVTAGLTLPYSSGKVEGNVNRTRCSNGKCMAVPDSTCSVSESCWHDQSRDHHEMWGRTRSITRNLQR